MTVKITPELTFSVTVNDYRNDGTVVLTKEQYDAVSHILVRNLNTVLAGARRPGKATAVRNTEIEIIDHLVELKLLT